MRVLVTGANGFVGRAMCQYLAAHDYDVLPVVRRICGLQNEIIADINTPRSVWLSMLSQCDAVIHLAGRAHVMRESAADPMQAFVEANVEFTKFLAEMSADASVARFVFVSTIKVNGETACAKKPFSADAAINPSDCYSQSKWMAEQVLIKLATRRAMEVVIVRPPLIYGAGVKGNFQSLVRWMGKGWPLPFGAVANCRSLVGVTNLASFLSLCANRDKSPKAANEIFLISDAESLSTTALLKRMAKAAKRQPLLLPVPLAALRFLFNFFGKSSVSDRLLGSLVVDASKAYELTGWKPELTLDEELNRIWVNAANI